MKQYYVFAKTNIDQIITKLVTASDYYEVERAVDNIIKKHGNVIYVIYPADTTTYYDALRNFADYIESQEAL